MGVRRDPLRPNLADARALASCVLLPQPEVDYLTTAGMLYMFPRRDGILLGGTTERGEWDLGVNEDAKAKMIAGHRAFFAGEKPV